MKHQKKQFNQFKKIALDHSDRLNQKILAEKLGVTKGLVHHWCTGRCRPTYEMLFKLRDLLHDEYGCQNVTVEILMRLFLNDIKDEE